jgi:hypothetical protein
MAVKGHKIRREPLNTDFKTLYRFDRDNVHALAVYFLGRHHVETRGGALSAEQKMRIFLRYMADPGFHAGIGEEVGSSKYSFKNFIRSHDKNSGKFRRVDKISIYK